MEDKTLDNYEDDFYDIIARISNTQLNTHLSVGECWMSVEVNIGFKEDD